MLARASLLIPEGVSLTVADVGAHAVLMESSLKRDPIQVNHPTEVLLSSILKSNWPSQGYSWSARVMSIRQSKLPRATELAR